MIEYIIAWLMVGLIPYSLYGLGKKVYNKGDDDSNPRTA